MTCRRQTERQAPRSAAEVDYPRLRRLVDDGEEEIVSARPAERGVIHHHQGWIVELGVPHAREATNRAREPSIRFQLIASPVRALQR